MKKRNWLLVAMILVCLGTLIVYRTMRRVRSDTTAPQITIGEVRPEISVKDDEQMLLQGITAQDKRDGDVTASLVVENIRLLDPDGTVEVAYAAFDKAGNVAKDRRQLRYTDYESPRFSLSRPLLFSAGSSVDVLNAIRAEDLLDGNISHQIRATSLTEGTISDPGIHNVQFQVTNSLGDTVKLVLPVEVHDGSVYNGKLDLTTYLIYLDRGDTFRAETYLKSFAVGRDTYVLNGTLPGNFSLSTTGSVDTSTPGVYSMFFKVAYQMKNKNNGQELTYTGCSKLIVVVEG